MLLPWPPRLCCALSTPTLSPSPSLPSLRCRRRHVPMERRVRSSANAVGGPPPRPNHDHQHPQTQDLSSTTGVAPLIPPISIKLWNLPDQHLLLLSTVACMTGVAVSALFLSAIPTLLAFKRAAESLEKLLNVTREELPGTMAAVRLSGMEISDLTMELSEIGQEISSGVKSSTRVVRAAQDGLRHVSSIATTGSSNLIAKKINEANRISRKRSS